VTYVSEGYCHSTVGGYTCKGGDYVLNPPPDTTVWGAKVALGKNYAASVVLDDGTAYSAQPSMDLTSTTTSNVQPFSCTPMILVAPTMGKACSQSSSTTTMKSGYLSTFR